MDTTTKTSRSWISRRMRCVLVQALILIFIGLSTVGGCTINFGSGTGGTGCGTYCTDLGVPFRQQDTSYYCGPATILMWRLFDGLPEISQSEIATAIGCGSSGVSMGAIASGVQQFTSSGYDVAAVFGPQDNQGSLDEIQGRYYSSEISSVSHSIPLISNYGFNHAVIVSGGRWSKPASYYVWEYVRINDPFTGGGQDLEVQGADWIADTWGQGRVIDWSHHINGTPLNSQYGDDVAIGGTPGGGNWPPPI